LLLTLLWADAALAGNAGPVAESLLDFAGDSMDMLFADGWLCDLSAPKIGSRDGTCRPAAK